MVVTLSSGISLDVRPINPFFAGDALTSLRKLYPEPEPPMQEVEGLEGKVHLEPNTMVPEHLLAKRQWSAKVNAIMYDWMLDDAVVVDVDAAAVSALREKYASRGMDLPQGDKIVYITRIAMRTVADINAVRSAMEGESFVTEEAVADKAASFKSAVPGA